MIFTYHRKILQRYVSLFVLLVLFFSTFSSVAYAQKFNIVYIMADDIEQALDYKENIEAILGNDISRKLQIVRKDNKFGVIYDGDDSSLSITKTLVEHGDLLEKAGFDQPYASKDSGYSSLYNVSYGLGRNVEDLKKVYHKVYGTLGEDVGHNLFIEETDYGNYTLIYRRRGDKESTYKVAKRHARMLRSKKIKTSIAQENNNEVVFGESSLLNEEEEVDVTVADEEIILVKQPQLPNQPKQVVAVKEVKVIVPKTVKPVKVVMPLKPVLPKMVEAVEIVATKSYIARDKTRIKKKRALVSSKRALPRKKPSRFETSIESYIASLRRKGKISKDEATGWMVFDLANGKSVVDINADRKFQAASMIKPFVALAFFHQVKQGKLKYGPKSRRHMAAMIQRSNNASTNWVMRQVGGPATCEAIIQKNYPHIFKGTEIKEYIPANGRTYKNSAYPSDYVRFLRDLWDRKLPYSKEIRRLMALPGRDRLYNGTPIPRGTLVYNKTGSTAHLCGDMGILVPKTRSGSRYPYVIVGVIEKKSRPKNYGSWVATRSKVIRQVSTLVYEQMKKDHQLL